MIYGKVECAIESIHGRMHLTVAHTVSIKQGSDLIRLTFDEARELTEDLAAAILELEADRSNISAK